MKTLSDYFIQKLSHFASIKLGYVGDYWSAIQDCDIAIKLDPAFHKPYYRRAQALLKLKNKVMAKAAVEKFEQTFPMMAKDIENLYQNFEELEKEIGMNIVAQVSDDKAEYSEEDEDEDEGFAYDGDEEASSTGGVSESKSSDDIAKEGYVPDNSKEIENQVIIGFEQRYIGSMNDLTDIKEATFIGNDSRLIACGSDDGKVKILSIFLSVLINLKFCTLICYRL